MAADNRRCTTTDRPADRRPLEALGVIAETRSRVSYDAPKNAPPWGWHVSGYLLTKALAAGAARGDPTTVTIDYGYELKWVGWMMGLLGADKTLNFTVASTMRRE